MTQRLDLASMPQGLDFEPMRAYGQAKLASVLCTYALARRLVSSTVSVNAVHPGIAATDIVEDVAPAFARPFLPLIKRFLLTPEQGARAATHLALSAEVQGVSGRYFNRQKLARSVPASYDVALQERTWRWSQGLTGLALSEEGIV